MNESSYFITDQQLIDVLAMTPYPMAVHVTEDAIIQLANDAMITVWGKDRGVIGKSLEDALPELKGQPFIDLFKKVWREGITVSGKNTPADLIVDGLLQTFYFDYEYKAIINSNGETYAILHTAIDVSERFHSNQKVQQLMDELTATNEELSASNEEIRASNEELAATNEELSATAEELLVAKEHLEYSNRQLSAGEARFRQLIRQAPVGICLIRAKDLFIEEVNESYLELVGKHRSEFVNQTIWEAVPEAAAAYAPVMNDVIATGIPFIANEHELLLVRNGRDEGVFVNFVYEPIRSVDGTVEAILVIGNEVTELVRSRKKIELAEQRSRLAVEASGIGIFDLNLATGIPVVSGRFNEIFELTGEPGPDSVHQVTHPEDKIKRLAAHQEALETGSLFYEARIIIADGAVRWIRAQGKVFYDNRQRPERLLGTVLDITDYKAVQQQKDDFISIASHELKTPITSLKAYLQLMDRIKDKPDQAILPKLIMQSRKSVDRVSYLVEDLLNVSRLQQTEIQLDKHNFILSQLVNTVANPVSLTTKHKIVITGDLELEVYADEHRIDQVITNLLNNAVKYAPHSELISIHIKNDGQNVRLSVTDQGPGIPQEKLDQVFDRYFRVNQPGYQASGLGLGLYISNEIISRHGGQMGVNSTLGQGSTFWFTLPITH